MSAVLPPLTEKAFLEQVRGLARLLGWMVFHTHDSRRSEPGFPDLVLLRERVVWAELKTDTGRLTPAQVAWVEALRRAGQEVYLWRPSAWAEIHAVLR
jgi:hypothetical protein